MAPVKYNKKINPWWRSNRQRACYIMWIMKRTWNWSTHGTRLHALWEEGKLVLLERFACALPQSRNSSGMMEEHNQLKVLTNFIRSLSNRASVLKKLVCWRLQMQLRGSAANILVPDATAYIQQSAGIHVSISHDVVAADGGWTQY